MARPLSNRVGKLEKKERLDRIMKLISEGNLQFQIIDILVKEWGIGERAVRKYLTMVYAFLREEISKEDKDTAIIELKELEKEYKGKGDVNTFMKLKEMRYKVTGHYVTKVDVTSGGEKLPSINIIYTQKEDE